MTFPHGIAEQVPRLETAARGGPSLTVTLHLSQGTPTLDTILPVSGNDDSYLSTQHHHIQ